MSQRIYSRIIGTGAYLPEKILTNHDLEKMVDTTDEWIITRLNNNVSGQYFVSKYLLHRTQLENDITSDANTVETSINKHRQKVDWDQCGETHQRRDRL